jgi:hypothetical protein
MYQPQELFSVYKRYLSFYSYPLHHCSLVVLCSGSAIVDSWLCTTHLKVKVIFPRSLMRAAAERAAYFSGPGACPPAYPLPLPRDLLFWCQSVQHLDLLQGLACSLHNTELSRATLPVRGEGLSWASWPVVVWAPGAYFCSYFLCIKIALSIFGSCFRTQLFIGQRLKHQTS